MALNFTAIDFETANGSPASACSVGLVKVADGVIVDERSWLLRPPFGHDEFWESNIRVHGIQPQDVHDAPLWSEIAAELFDWVGSDWLVAHNAGFDMGVIRASHSVAGLTLPNLHTLCSLQVARRTYHLDSYRLPVAAMAAGFEDFSHHNALDDSRACAAIMVHAAKRHEVDDLAALAKVCGVTPGAIGPLAEANHRSTFGPMALQ
ncbi:MAG TPA: 3'-5' exonuclease [Microbacteriaceae bacterium]|nr:3'-5' exonuclease [Microbacteriaceae bacterium]